VTIHRIPYTQWLLRKRADIHAAERRIQERLQ
jgi:hypothetical protein